MDNIRQKLRKIYRGRCVVSVQRMLFGVLGLSIIASTTIGCTPTVRVATPEPITINLNVKIEHEIYIRVARELDEMFSDSSGLF